MNKDYEWLAKADRHIQRQRGLITHQLGRIASLRQLGLNARIEETFLNRMQEFLKILQDHRKIIIVQIAQRKLREGGSDFVLQPPTVTETPSPAAEPPQLRLVPKFKNFEIPYFVLAEQIGANSNPAAGGED
jgi:hypothetical protein